MRNLFMLAVSLLPAVVGVAAETGGKVPVLLELFTSEGCSSCPPADALLEKLDREQPVVGAEVIVLSEHVDYWNQLGWADPFSSALYSQRQRDYASRLDGQTYTPELVVDGEKGFIGSDRDAAQKAIRDAALKGKTTIGVSLEHVDGKGKVKIHLTGGAEGTVYLALAHDYMKSNVTRGENAGRGLSHVAVVFSIEKVAKADGKAQDFERVVSLKAGEATRVVAFVAQQGSGRVLALGQFRL